MTYDPTQPPVPPPADEPQPTAPTEPVPGPAPVDPDEPAPKRKLPGGRYTGAPYGDRGTDLDAA